MWWRKLAKCVQIVLNEGSDIVYRDWFSGTAFIAAISPFISRVRLKWLAWTLGDARQRHSPVFRFAWHRFRQEILTKVKYG
jgi:hypothetical protein